MSKESSPIKMPGRIRSLGSLCRFGLWAGAMVAGAMPGMAQTNGPTASGLEVLPDFSQSLLRVSGALIFVVALFLAGVWGFRNWQRMVAPRGQRARLRIVESRSLGHRHAVYVVGYEQRRFLISSSPGGINLLTPLPEEPPETSGANGAPSFAGALRQHLTQEQR